MATSVPKRPILRCGWMITALERIALWVIRATRLLRILRGDKGKECVAVRAMRASGDIASREMMVATRAFRNNLLWLSWAMRALGIFCCG
jgi:hypothetical protein